MAINPGLLQMIANPTGGKLSQIGETIARNRQQAIENKRAETAASESKKTADLQRQIYEEQLDEAQTDNLLTHSRILSGFTNQFRDDVQKNPQIIQNPDVYNQYMSVATKGLPEDVVNQLATVTPDKFELINRRSTRMVNALTNIKEKKAPTTRKVGKEIEGEQYVIDEEWNPVDNTWTEVGRSKKGSGVTVNTGEKESIKYSFRQLEEANKDSMAARKTKDNIAYAREAMEDIETGALTSFRVNLNRIGSSFGFTVQDDIPDIVGANTAFGNMVMAGLNSFPGQISEGERKFLEGRMPNIVQTKEGREQIMTLLDRLADRPIEYRKAMNEYMRKNDNTLMPGEGKDTFYDVWDKHVEETPLFKDLNMITEQPPKTEYVEVRTAPDGTKMGKKSDGTIEVIK